MTQKNEAAYLVANNNDPRVGGAGTVKVVILALILLLVGRKFGLAVSLFHFTGAIVLAALLYFVWRELRKFPSGQSGQG